MKNTGYVAIDMTRPICIPNLVLLRISQNSVIKLLTRLNQEILWVLGRISKHTPWVTRKKLRIFLCSWQRQWHSPTKCTSNIVALAFLAQKCWLDSSNIILKNVAKIFVKKPFFSDNLRQIEQFSLIRAYGKEWKHWKFQDIYIPLFFGIWK